GATLLPETVVGGRMRDGAGQGVGVRTRRPEGDIEAGVVVAADGVNSFLAKEAGLRGELRPDEVSLGVKEVSALDRRTIEERFALTGDEGATYDYVCWITEGFKGGCFLFYNRGMLSLCRTL